MKPILEVHNLSKEFLIGANNEPYLALRDVIANPFKLLNQPKKEVFKALDNVSFDVMPGESIGIIGRNGAGKSTLLKILSKITPPSSGKIICRGRIAALLEVGTGFHPELTGRENVYMNGSILGMRKWEIDKHFDEIVNFSGVEKFLDTPLKRYSSGMQLRLAFAVAAHLEPEILIIDEVLAVGDAEFQKKCLGKMDEVTKSGRTVLFVSHDLGAVQNLCTNSILVENGTLKYLGKTENTISFYKRNNNNKVLFNPNKAVYLKEFHLNSIEENYTNTCKDVSMYFNIYSKTSLQDIYIGIGINSKLGRRIVTPFSKHFNEKFNLNEGENIIKCEINNFPLKPDLYPVEIYIGDGYKVYDYNKDELTIDIRPINDSIYNFTPDESQGELILKQIWSKVK